MAPVTKEEGERLEALVKRNINELSQEELQEMISLSKKVPYSPKTNWKDVALNNEDI